MANYSSAPSMIISSCDGKPPIKLETEDISLTVKQLDWFSQSWSMDVVLSEREVNRLKMALCCQPMGVDCIDFNPDKGSTTVHWDDGTITTVRCAKGTEFDEYTAFTAALAKRLYGNNSAIRRMIHKKDSREIDRKQKEANLKAQAERERVAAKRRKERIKRMARKMKEEAEARKLAGIE